MEQTVNNSQRPMPEFLKIWRAHQREAAEVNRRIREGEQKPIKQEERPVVIVPEGMSGKTIQKIKHLQYDYEVYRRAHPKQSDAVFQVTQHRLEEDCL